VLQNSINRPINVPVVTTRCPCSSTWVVLDRELWVLVLVLVTWVLDISLVQKESNIV